METSKEISDPMIAIKVLREYPHIKGAAFRTNFLHHKIVEDIAKASGVPFTIFKRKNTKKTRIFVFAKDNASLLLNLES